MSGEALPLSVAIITKNEEELLADCLASVAMAAEIVVVDSHSVDRTVEIAQGFGARVYLEEWQGFGRQKQKAIDHCTQPWILVLDADERVSSGLAAEIRELLGSGPGSVVAWSVPRQNFFCGSWLRHAGWWPDRVVRLFRRGSARMSDRLVHETLVVDGPISELHFPLIHLTSRDLSQTLTKINHYSSAGAQELQQRGMRGSVGKAVLRASWAFFDGYFRRLGLLDGGPGLAQALTSAVYTLFKYLKLWELQRKTGLPDDPPGRSGS